MGILPRQFKALMEMLRVELSLLREVIQKSNAAISDQQVSQNQDQKKAAGEIQRSITSLYVPPQERAQTETNQERRHGENLRIQRALVSITGLAFLAAALYAYIAFLQWRGFEETIALSQITARQARVQAVAAQVAANAAKSAADTADRNLKEMQKTEEASNVQFSEQLNRLDASIKEARRLADETVKANENVIASDRPWMGGSINVEGFESGKTPTYSVIFINSGKRPARVTLTQTLATPNDFGNNPTYRPYDTTPSITILVPGQPMGAAWKDDTSVMNPISKPIMDELNSGTLPFRIYARVEYTDLRTGDTYWTHLCWRYTPTHTAINGGFSNCNEYNDAK